MKRERKVQGAQWYITLPQEWRAGQDVKKGDTMITLFEEHSMMVVYPENREVSELENKLSNVLINLPSLTDTRELVNDLREIVADLDEA